MRNLLVVLIAIALVVVFVAWQDRKDKTEMLKVGDHIPDFTLPDQDGNPFHIASYIGQKNLVIYFYPKDDTPGCTKEACGFRDSFEDFTDLDAMVIGISGDSPESHRDFIAKYNLPFTLLSDTSGTVRKQFGVKGDFMGMIPGRVSFVVDKDGIIRFVFDSQTKALKHVEKAKQILSVLNNSPK